MAAYGRATVLTHINRRHRRRRQAVLVWPCAPVWPMCSRCGPNLSVLARARPLMSRPRCPHHPCATAIERLAPALLSGPCHLVAERAGAARTAAAGSLTAARVPAAIAALALRAVP